MAGGLLQIASYGSQDLFLTGNPQITFFKVVYRRYTNFSVESIKMPFDDPTGFGLTSHFRYKHTGDLLYKTYIDIELPEMDIKRIIPSTSYATLFDQAKTDYYGIVLNFMQVDSQAYRDALTIYETIGTTTSEMINTVKNAFANSHPQTLESDFEALCGNISPFYYNFLSTSTYNLHQIVISLEPLILSLSKDDLMKYLQYGIDNAHLAQKYFFDQLNIIRIQYEDSINPNILFAWVKKIGHVILDSVEVSIGGQTIDKHYGDWLNIWHELTGNKDLEEVYNRMIGNISELITLDRNSKPKYVLHVPLQFWFCHNNGLALPLVALQYHDVDITTKFRKIYDCGYLGEQLTGYDEANRPENQYLDDYLHENGKDITAYIVSDFIFLDAPERRRFAQSIHEYMIDQLQIIEFPEINQTQLQCILNFSHPVKEVVWVAQDYDYTINENGYRETHYERYDFNTGTITNPKYINPISYSSMSLNSYLRVIKQSNDVFNYVYPRIFHSNTPECGINMYSFSLSPEEQQPSGACNMTRIKQVKLDLFFDDDVIAKLNKGFNVRVYGIRSNILRFIKGMGGVAFVG